MGLFGLHLPKKVDNIIGAVQAQVNPFDNGATYNTVRQGVQPAPPAQHPTLINNIGKAVVGVPRGIVSGGEGLVKAGIIGPAVQTIAAVRGNPYEQAAANQYQAQAVDQVAPLIHGITRTIPEAVTSLTGQQTTYHPQTPIEQAIFGKTPVQNIEKKVANNYDQHTNLNPLVRVGLAGLELGGSVIQDIPVVGGAAKLTRAAGLTEKGVGAFGMSTKNVGGVNKPNIRIDEMGVRVKDVPLGPLDASIADHVQKINDAGYNSIASASGIKRDYPVYKGAKQSPAGVLLPSKGAERYSPYGYMAFIKKANTPEKLAAIEKAAKDSGLAVEHGDTYFQPSLTVRNGLTKAGKSLKDIMNEANAIADEKHGDMFSKKGEELSQWLKTRDAAEKKLTAKYGGNISDSEIAKRWQKFTDHLTQPAKTPVQQAVDEAGGAFGNFDKIAARTPEIVKERKAAKFPTEAEFNKMIPAVKGRKSGYGSDNSTLTPAEKAVMVEQTDKGIKLGPAEVNTKRNPFKSIRQNVQQGDYGAVVSNEQAIAKPIDTIGGQWAQAMKKLAPDERANFWRHVEAPANPAHSPALQRAISLWREADNRVHANSQALGGNTNYLTDHALHPWQLPEEYLNHIINGGNPDKFAGLNNISRKYRTIAEGEKAGLTLGTDPIGEGSRYLRASSSLLRRASLKQDVAQADAGNLAKTHILDLGNGHSVAVSATGAKALRGVQAVRTSNSPLVKGVRTANVGLKSTLLSGGQFHPINISLLRAAPALVATGHPVLAAKGLYGTFRAAFGTAYAEKVIGAAIKDGTVDKAAKIGMPYGGGGYDTTGSLIKGGVGHHTVFEKQMPMMHDAVVRSILKDLEKKNVSLDSEAARRAGASGNRLMGFINKEAANISPGVQNAMGDWLLAGQFTPSKIGQVKATFNPASYRGGAVAGKYAAASTAANVAAASAMIIGLGYVVKQKSDDVKDMLIRALTDPAVPTPFKDTKGNNIKLRLPGTDTSDISKLLGIKPVRGADGHLSISWSPSNMPQTLEDFARARLAPLPSSAVKVATNSTFSNKPLYDPNAPGSTKAGQIATTLAVGQLPIGVQGAAYTKAVKDHLPQSSRDVLNAGTPGSNPVVKSIGASFGLSPATDTTTGKGLQTSQYFDQLKQAKVGLTSADQKTFDSIFGSKKNPVSGKYDNPANVWDSGARATLLLDHPKVLAAAVKMNTALAAQGQKVDPLYDKGLTTKQRQTFLAYTAQTEPATRAEMRLENPWINDLNKTRSKFFDSLPLGDPNKPKSPIAYPTPSKSVAGLQDQYFGLSGPAQKVKFIQANPELATQFAAEDQYNRSVRDAKNLPQYDSYPTAPAGVQKSLDTYEALPKNDGPKGGSKTRSLWIQSHPKEWSAITTYLTQTSLYNLQQSAQKAAFQKQGFDQKGLKAISSLGQYDIGKTTDANGNVIYAIAPGSKSIGGYSSGSGGYYQSGSPKIAGGFPSGKTISPTRFMKRIPVAGGPRLPHGGAKIPRPKTGKVGKSRVAVHGRSTKKENQERSTRKITLA